jgi:hypothetical protein
LAGVLSIAAISLNPSSASAQAVPGKYIVVFHPDVRKPAALARELARPHSAQVGHVYRHALQGFSFAGGAVAAHAISQNPQVAFVEPALACQASQQTLPTGVDRIDADLNSIALINGIDERVDVDIAIIDTGIDLDHPDLNVVWNESFTKAHTGNDDSGHGSHVAGTAAALDNDIGVVGVAPGARLWALKSLDRKGRGTFADTIAAIDFVFDHADEIEVVNMSLAGAGVQYALREAIHRTVDLGVVFIVAAGNSRKDVYGPDGVFETNDDEIPAAYPEVAAISAMCDTDGQRGGLGENGAYGTPDDKFFRSLSNFSTSVVEDNPVTSCALDGAAIDLAAPGVYIYSTWKNGGYNTSSGTSMAAPHVAGAAALYIAEHGRANDAAGVAVIRQALIDAAETQRAWGAESTNDRDTNPEGLVNAAAGLPPTVSILNPIEGEPFELGDPITFLGFADDLVDGVLTAGLVWESDIDGEIGMGGSFFAALSQAVHTITASVMDSEVKTGCASITITVGTPPEPPSLDEEPVFEEYFEDGFDPTTWTTEGNTNDRRNELNRGEENLWDITDNRGCPELPPEECGHTSTHSWYYGIEGEFTYNNHKHNWGRLITPSLPGLAIDLTGKTIARLDCNFWWEREGPTNVWERPIIQISTTPNDLDSWITVSEPGGYASADHPDATATGWVPVQVDISSFTGQVIYVGFFWDTRDNRYNGFEGWYVDDVVVWAGQ